MQKSESTTYIPGCMLAHDLINRLAVIVGYCDLLVDEDESTDAKQHKRLTAMRDIAVSTVEELRTHRCKFEIPLRASETRNAKVTRHT